ncbi:MAG: hypothetical protein JKY86_10210 [Gammaproteobacteria bacterium]|nr:hypothetical protein [Gammaproteobacteria bacterium]
MSISLVIAAAGATFIGGLQTQLSPAEVENLDIVISAVDAEKEHRHPYPLFLFEVDLSQFDACILRGVWIQFFNDQGQQVFSSSIEAEFGLYHFQILEEYLDAATLGITCDAGPDALDPSYTIDLREYGRAP